MIIELIGVAIIVGAAAASTLRFIRAGVATAWNAGFHQYRANLGRGILLGLEFLVAADIIGTVAVTPSFQSLGILGLIIAIRTFLSLSLEIEIEGGGLGGDSRSTGITSKGLLCEGGSLRSAASD